MLDEKYRIDSLLAVGGMGAVYVGTHTKLRKRVAIKVLNPELSNPQMIERFHREAITASQVGAATKDDLDYLVSKGLLTQDRATAIAAT